MSEPSPQVDEQQIDGAALRARVQEALSRARAVPASTPAPRSPGRSAGAALQDVDRALTQAAEHWAVGSRVPPMHKLHGVLRLLATPTAKALLRAAQLITRDQRDFNGATLQALQQLRGLLGARLDESSSELQTMRAAITRDQKEREELQAALTSLVAENEAHRREVEAQTRTLETVRAELRDSTERLRNEIVRREEVQRGLVLQERRLTVLIEEARRRLPGPLEPSQIEVLASEGRKMREAIYPAFEDSFRGSSEEIQGRVRAYLPWLREARAGEARRPILDLGCGRGELLMLLREEGLEGMGVDLNDEMVERSRAAGLKVERGDAVSYLRGLPDASVGAVTAIHVIEHLPLETNLSLFEECARVLKPGGIAIFETPNPENIVVGACNFYMDPTHLRPLHPSTMRYLAEARGLVRVRVEYFRPMAVPDLGPAQLTEWVRTKLLGPQDYAVVGYRPVESA